MFEPYIERPVAAEVLTTLAQSLKAPNLSPLLLQVWGVGGVGKSTLARRAEAANSLLKTLKVRDSAESRGTN